MKHEPKWANNIAAVGLFYRATNPREIFVEMKDDGYPFEVFRNHLNMIGGNWINDAALSDMNPRDTFVREVCEELSFEREVIDSEDYEKLGLGAHASYQQVINPVMPSTKDKECLARIKECTRIKAHPVGDFLVHTPAEVFAQVPQKKVREAHTGLVSFWVVPMGDELWEELTRLQKKFGNLSNESITVLTSVNEIVEKSSAFGWGQAQLLARFVNFTTERGEKRCSLPGVPGISITPMPDPMSSYRGYLATYHIAKHPRPNLDSLVEFGKAPENSDGRRDIQDLLDPKAFPEARHVNLISFKSRMPGKPWTVGNHFHHDHERFRIVSGTMQKLVLEDLITGVRRSWENLSPGTVISIPPLVSHAFLPGEGAVMAGALRNGFDPNDMKTFRIMDDYGNELPSPVIP